jgi:hypothetical protein
MRDFYSAWLYGGRCTTYEIGLLKPSNKFHKIAIERWNELVKLPLILAVKAKRTGKIYLDGNAHGDVRVKHNLENNEFIRGFVHKDRFITAEEAQAFVKKETGYTTSNETLMSGEEWIPKIEDSNDAVKLGRKLHQYGRDAAQMRINIFENKKINHNHVRLLKIMIEEYSVWKQTVLGRR